MSNKRIDNFVWPVDFVCTLVTENLMLPNAYSMHIGLEPITSNNDEISLGFKKIKFFLTDYLQNSIFLNKNNLLIKSLNTLDTNMVLFPEDPSDYLIASVFYQKFSAIMSNYFSINFLSLDSAIGDHIQYTITDIEEINFDLTGDFWWNKDSVNTGTDDHTTWETLNLINSPKFAPVIIQGGLSEN
jgi:hypothetical protein